MISAVIDTNVIISALFWKGVPREVFNAALDNQFLTLSSGALTGELQRVLGYPKFVKEIEKRGKDVERLVAAYQAVSVFAVPADDIPDGIVRDPKDKMVLECAVGGKADYIVSGDKDLLVLKAYRQIQIVTLADFLQLLSERESSEDGE